VALISTTLSLDLRFDVTAGRSAGSSGRDGNRSGGLVARSFCSCPEAHRAGAGPTVFQVGPEPGRGAAWRARRAHRPRQIGGSRPRSLYREPESRAELSFGAIEFHDVFKIFRSGPAETVALRGLDLRIATGEIAALYGPSGSGKSTALHLAAGLDEPSAGDVRVFGRSLARLDDAELAAYRAREVSIVFQSANLWSSLTTRENIRLALRLAGKPGGDALVDRALDVFGLRKREHVAAGALSGGEQQRTAIAAASARESPLVLADEPTAELDVESERAVLTALRRLRDEFAGTVVIVTHSPRVAEAADRVIELRDGATA
jgi:putative ABC transport system ATP-binding protein